MDEGVLAEVRVVVVGASLAATLCGSLLAEYGADVVKVEPPEGDPLRRVGPMAAGASLRWATAARGVRSVTCDPTAAEGARLLRRLVDGAVILCDGTGSPLGTGPGATAGPGQVVLHLPALGDGTDGPGSLGDGLVAAAHAGLLHVTGHPDGPPTRLGSDVVELLSAAYGAEAAIAALLRRHRTGAGARILCSQAGAVLRVLEWTIVAYDVARRERRREGNFPTAVAPIGSYVAADGGLVGIVGASDANFRRLTDAMGQPELRDDPLFATGPLRATHAADINALVAAWVAAADAAVVIDRCQAHGVIVAGVQPVGAVVADRSLWGHGDLVRVPGAAGELAQPAPQPHTRHHVATLAAAPELASSNAAIWGGEVGLAPAELAALRDAGVV